MLIYSDTTKVVDVPFIQAEQTEQGRKIILLTLPSLSEAFSPSGGPGGIIAAKSHLPRSLSLCALGSLLRIIYNCNSSEWEWL